MSVGSLVNKRKAVFYGWWVVAAATFVNLIGIGAFFYGWSTFFKPLTREFGWSRTQVSFISSLSRLEGGLEGPVAGWLIDKAGSRKVLLASVFVTGLGFIALSRVNSFPVLAVTFAILALGYNFGFTFATTAAVAKWFIRKRSLALSFLTTGNGVGGAIFVPLLAWMILTYGWRWAAVITGVTIWVVVLPVVYFGIKDSPEQMGMLPDGGPATASAASKQDQGLDAHDAPASISATGLAEINLSTAEALRTQAFWNYAAAMFFRSTILSSIVLHEIPHLTDVGIPEVQAASVLGMMVLFSVPGRLAFGWLGDRSSKKLLLLVSSILQAIGIMILIRTTTISMAYLFVIVYGLGYGGAIPLTSALRADLFGRKSFASINGLVTPITMISGIAGPIVAGYLYDSTQSYTIAFTAFAIMITVSGFLFLFIRQPRSPVRPAQAATH